MQPTRSDRFRRKQLFNIAALIAVVVLIAGVFFLVEIIKSHVAPQNCHMAGFKNCAVDAFGRPR